MIQHTIDIAVGRHEMTIDQSDITSAIESMRTFITEALREQFGVGGHLTYRWELALRSVGGNLLLRTWHPGDDLPVGSRKVTLIGQGFAHTASAAEDAAGSTETESSGADDRP